MIDIRPISDLRNHFSEIEAAVSSGSPVFLTKNGYGSMVVMSIDQYENLTNSDIVRALEEASINARQKPARYSLDEAFGKVKDELEKI